MPAKKTTELQKVFQLIEEGNVREVSDDRWGAVECYAQARTLLTQLSNDSAKEPSKNDEEQTKIVNLYKRQSREYLHRARKCFLDALQSENEQDEEMYRGDAEVLDNHPPKFASLTAEEAERRIQNFITLFSKETRSLTIQSGEKDADVDEKQSSLEERLRELNQSIPHGFKTSAEKIKELNQGLRRLGLNLYTEDSHSEPLSLRLKPEHEQVADIIAQAKDEVKFSLEDNTVSKEPEAHKVSKDDETESNDDDDDEEEEEDEAVESDDNDILLHRKAIRKQVVEAQIELENLMALLDKQPIALDNSKAKHEVDLMRGKKALTDAKRYLSKALKLWQEDS